MLPDIRAKTSWDFRSSQELLLSDTYAKEGYVIEDADFEHLEYMKNAILSSKGRSGDADDSKQNFEGEFSHFHKLKD